MGQAAGSLFLISIVALSLSFIAIDVANEPLLLEEYFIGKLGGESGLGGPAQAPTPPAAIPTLAPPKIVDRSGRIETSTGKFSPRYFRGPSGPPSIIGPRSNPPDN